MKPGRKPSPLPDDFRQLVESGEHTVGSLSRHYTVSPKAVNGWLERHGIERPRAQFVDLPDEEWRVVGGWEGFYEVSNLGRVRSLDRVSMGVRVKGRIMKPHGRTKDLPYDLVTLHRGGRGNGVSTYVHNLVLTAFRGSCPEGKEACHNDGNGMNNVLTNLRWDTHVSNMADQVKHGTHAIRIQKYRATRARAC